MKPGATLRELLVVLALAVVGGLVTGFAISRCDEQSDCAQHPSQLDEVVPCHGRDGGAP